jgi:hypothetical protein
MERRAHVECPHGRKGFVVGLEEGTVMYRSRAVHQDVDPAEERDGARHDVPECVGIGEVGGKRRDTRRRAREVVEIAMGSRYGHDVGTAFREGTHDGATDATAPARHQRTSTGAVGGGGR